MEKNHINGRGEMVSLEKKCAEDPAWAASEIERLEHRVSEVLKDRDEYDLRRRESMQSVEKWRLKCFRFMEALKKGGFHEDKFCESCGGLLENDSGSICTGCAG